MLPRDGARFSSCLTSLSLVRHLCKSAFVTTTDSCPHAPVRTRVGAVEVIALSDATIVNAPHEAAPGVDVAQLASHYPDLVTPDGHWPGPVTCYLLRSEGKWILADSGIGSWPRPGWPRGRLDRLLEDVGVAPADVALVLNTHLHDDHVGWNTVDDGSGVPMIYFSSARFPIQRAEWEFWVTDEKVALPGHEYLAQCVVPLRDAGVVDLVGPRAPITGEIAYVDTHGHTPGHVAIEISSQGESALIVGDATHYRAQLDHPEWSPTWDEDARQAEIARRSIFDSLADRPGARIIAGHWRYPGIGRIVSNQVGMEFHASV
jgi:glyoxylase-like metal-dependent hydrolase (beta-lactamase superfamily II)